MKSLILVTFALIATMPFCFAEDDIYPLDIQVRVYPKEIHYGDVCFIIYSVTNQGTETLLLPHGRTFFKTMGGVLFYEQRDMLNNEKRVLLQFGRLDDSEEYLFSDVTFYFFSGHPVKPGETMVFYIMPVWLPRPEFAERDNAVEIRKIFGFDTRGCQFAMRLFVDYHWAYRWTHHPRLDANGQLMNEDELEGLTARQLAAKRPEYPYDEANSRQTLKQIDCTIKILPRSPDTSTPRREVPGPEEDLLLLQEWFLELPTTEFTRGIMTDGVFAHPFRVRDSPFKMEAPTPNELRQKREPYYKAYREFFTSMETRTPELLARIKRTNELAAKIIERSKEPDSTFSQNMVEFIQLRGFLVDMRYAENPEAEEAAFQKLMDFVDASQDKELWVPFMHEIGLYSIQNYTHFPRQKVEQYRDRFAERFQIEQKGLLN